jgi:UDP-3-O-[3-hydroxymyristoyl] glucosamine N-acyltransferase
MLLLLLLLQILQLSLHEHHLIHQFGSLGLQRGAHVRIGACGRQCLVGDLAFVREQVQIGDRVIVGTHVTVENAVSIGDNVKIQTGAYITAWTTIEADCFIAPCVVTTNDNYMGRTERRFAERGGAVIRRGARVGANVTLLPNIEVGEEAYKAKMKELGIKCGEDKGK